MENFIEMLSQPLKEFWTGLVSFVPGFTAMFIIIAGGILISYLAKALFVKGLKAANFDSLCDRLGITAVIRKGDVWERPVELFGHIIYWFLIIIFVMIGLNALQIQTIDNLIAQFFVYLPRAFSALLILVIGYVIAGFLSRAILIAAVNNGYHYAKVLAEAVRLLLIVLILAMALEQLQVAPGIVVAAFSIIFSGIVLAIAIAFGVGGIDAAKKIIEKGSDEKKEDKGRDIEHI
ncbi:MAG: hypothetical protein A2073_02585 [Deltaproteobacteria bacterium GWC2_42_11]|nr:MAG: hypothetical protein A2073_02585 [Deltaproteobacteria bacterium GWC2_42_11]HBO83903.1 hypothetical protein [Deltaproteobacteria bacterium]